MRVTDTVSEKLLVGSVSFFSNIEASPTSKSSLARLLKQTKRRGLQSDSLVGRRRYPQRGAGLSRATADIGPRSAGPERRQPTMGGLSRG